MDKEGKWALRISVILLVVLVIVLFLYFALLKPGVNYSQAELTNPVANLTLKQAIAGFDESYVSYMLYSIKAYNLHKVPLTSNYPIIEIKLEDGSYNAKIVNGNIIVNSGVASKEDIVITTTKEEIVKMMQDSSYSKVSFSSGSSSIEMVADKTTLFAKGYLNLYSELTGDGVTGNIIRIYFG